MTQDALDPLHQFLLQEKYATLDWLLDLVPLLPEQLMGLVVQIAEASPAATLRESLLKQVARKLEPAERQMLLNNISAAQRLVHLVYPVTQGAHVSLAFNFVNSSPYEIPVEIDGRKLANVGTAQKPKYVFNATKRPAELYTCEIQNPLHKSGLRGARIDLYVKRPAGGRYPDLRLRPKTGGGILEFYVKDQSASRHIQKLFQQLTIDDQKRFLELVLNKVKGEAGSRHRDSLERRYKNWELDERRLQRRGSQHEKRVRKRTDFSNLRYMNSEVLRKYRDRISELESIIGIGEAPKLVFERRQLDAERRDIVNLGFSDGKRADKFYDKRQALICDHSYYFWLNIGAAMPESIGTNESINVEQLPPRAQLHVALFGFENEIEVIKGEDVGVLQVLSDASFVVAKQAAHKERLAQEAELSAGFLSKFLLFPVRTPEQEGDYRLRCSIYCEQVLLQSYVLTAHVASAPTTMPEPFGTTLDYALSRTLEPGHLTKVASEPHLLSLMLNSNGDGSYTFRFFGADGQDIFKDNSPIDGEQMKGFLKLARSAMNKVSWDDESQWKERSDFNYSYRYLEESFDEAKLAKDLAYLARAGWRIYVGILNHLQTRAGKLGPLMRETGTVQVALKMSPRAVLPIAVVYDYNWDPDAYQDFSRTRFMLCETFSAAIANARKDSAPLENAACFNGGCALKARIDEITAKGSGKTLRSLPPMICPSGFWGYRHHVGLPLTRDGAASDKMPLEIFYKEEPEIVVAVSTDPTLVEREGHLDRLKVLKTPLGFERGESYKEVVLRLKETAPHLLYFYCHGGIRANNFPYLQIGKDDKFAPEHLIGEGIVWDEPQPLVFINGCNTTSLNPEITLDFVSAFVQQGGAAGVIGTEITIFEPLAVSFAEACLRRFFGSPPFTEGVSIGKAVRGARLELLRRGNPLGLVYIPFAIASLKLEQRS